MLVEFEVSSPGGRHIFRFFAPTVLVIEAQSPPEPHDVINHEDGHKVCLFLLSKIDLEDVVDRGLVHLVRSPIYSAHSLSATPPAPGS